MNQADVSWPTAPTGIAPVGRVSDPELRELARLLREDSTSEWFERVKPPKNPHPTVTKLPDYDHEEELAAVPEEPTESYRQQALEYVEGLSKPGTRCGRIHSSQHLTFQMESVVQPPVSGSGTIRPTASRSGQMTGHDRWLKRLTTENICSSHQMTRASSRTSSSSNFSLARSTLRRSQQF